MNSMVANLLEITGKESEREAMFAAIQDEEEGPYTIDFNKIIPMPETLEMEAGTSTNKGLDLYKRLMKRASAAVHKMVQSHTIIDSKDPLIVKYNRLLLKDPEAMRLGQQAYENLQKYGAPTWYEWCPEHWGSLRPAFYYSDLEPGDSDQSVRMRFRTKGGGVAPVIKALAAKYPKLKFKYAWAKDGLGEDVGMAEYVDGQEIDCYIPIDYSKEAFELAAKIHGVCLADERYMFNVKTGSYEYDMQEDDDL